MTMRSFDENQESLVELRKYIQACQEKIISFFSKETSLAEVHQKLLEYNKSIQKELIANFDFENDEDVTELFCHLKNVVDEMFPKELILKKIMYYVLDLYQFKVLDILLEKKEEILYKDKQKIKKEEARAREFLIKRVQDIQKEVGIFNNLLRNEHKTYKIHETIFDLSQDNLFKGLIQEENYFERMLDNSEPVNKYKKNRDILVNRLTILKDEVKKISDAFSHKLQQAMQKRLKKISEIKNEFKIDPFYLQDFLKTDNPIWKNKIENYRKINENNVNYDKICLVKSEADKIDLPLKDLIKNIESYFQSITYYEWLLPSALETAVDKIYGVLKADALDFQQKSKILKIMSDIEHLYKVIQQDVPQFFSIVENEFFEVAANYIQQIYKKYNEDELRKLEKEANESYEKEKNDFLSPIRLEVDLEDIDPICFKELHRRELDQTWRDAFQQVLTHHSQAIHNAFLKINSNDPEALCKVKDLEGELYSIKNNIRAELISIQADANRERIDNFLSEVFERLKIFQDIKKCMAYHADKKYETVPLKLNQRPLETVAQDSRENSRFRNFLRVIWNGLKQFFSQLVCCHSAAVKHHSRVNPKKSSVNGSYKQILDSPVGQKINKPPTLLEMGSHLKDFKGHVQKVEKDSKEILHATIGLKK
jgi:hypothetical protein